MLSLLKKGLKSLLAKRGLTITRLGEASNTSSRGYISAKETISSAERAELSICDYVENLWNQQGNTQAVIDQMALNGAFTTTRPNVVEIGAGTGRYLEKALQKCSPAKYESYETAIDWAEWLKSKYPIISHEADGSSLKQTPDNSTDLVHAHGVFVYLPFLVSFRYWKEIWRITKEDGVVVFDIFSEDSLSEEAVETWIDSNLNYPCFLSKQYVTEVFSNHGFSLVACFKNRLGKGYSEYLVFKRNLPTKK